MLLSFQSAKGIVGNRPENQSLSNKRFPDVKHMSKHLPNADILRHSPGNHSLFQALFPDGHIESSRAQVLKNGDIRVDVQNLTTSEVLLDLYLKKTREGWEITGQNITRKHLLPNNVPLDLLPIEFWAFSYATSVVNKFRKKTPNPKQQPQQRLDPNLYCVDHDILCSPLFPDSNWPWTGDRRHVQFWAPCVGSFKARVVDCCEDHDIALWCADNSFNVVVSHDAVKNCIINRILDEALRIVHEFSGNFLVEAFCVIVVTAWVTIAGTIGGVLWDLFADIFNNSPDPPLVGWGGVNKESCLCGGKVDTVLCNDMCRNLCREKNKDPNCYWCTWKCNHDPKTGRPISVTRQTDPSGSLPCCLGSAGSIFATDGRTITCDGAPQAVTTCSNLCTPCMWFCDYTIAGHPRWAVKKPPGKEMWQCCAGSDSPPRGLDGNVKECPKLTRGFR